MKNQLNILQEVINSIPEVDQPYFDNDDATIYDGNSSAIFKAMELAAKQAFEYSRLIIDNPKFDFKKTFDDENPCFEAPEIQKYEEFEDYLKDLNNDKN